MVKRCQSCQRNNPDDATFCSSCGAKLAGSPAAVQVRHRFRFEVSSGSPGNWTPIQIRRPRKDLISSTQYMMPGERLLISSESAGVKAHESAALAVARHFASGSQRALGHYDAVRPPPRIRWGALVITDRRMFVATAGIISADFVMILEAIYDPDYTKQRLESVKARNELIEQQAKNVSMFSRGKFMTEQGYQSHITILTGASLQKARFGGEWLLLEVYRVVFDKDAQKQLKWESEHLPKGLRRPLKGLWELRLRQPLKVTNAAVSVPSGNGRISYGPILDLLQSKAEELSGLVKDLEAAATHT